MWEVCAVVTVNHKILALFFAPKLLSRIVEPVVMRCCYLCMSCRVFQFGWGEVM